MVQHLRKGLAVFILLWPLALRAQNSAEIQGRVFDSTHHPVVSAFVIITGQNISCIRAATTDEQGSFVFPSLPVGSYQLQVNVDGYSPYSAKDVRASIGEVVKLEITLGQQAAPGSNRPSSGSMVESDNAQLGVVMGEQEVVELPLKSRDTFDLLQLQPGVQSTLGADLFYGSDQPGVVSVSGGRARSNNYSVNGGASGDQMINFPSVQPSPDSISEFRVLSHNYDATSGRNSASVLDVITRSGGSALHGSVFEFLRNNILNSKGYFDSSVPDFKQNEFGATLGGPLRRGKTFFFASYEGRRTIQGISSSPVIVPTSQERSGDFSAGPPFTGVLKAAPVAQALTTRPGCSAAVAANGGVAIAAGTPYNAIFPGNIIPASCFDATAADLLNQFVPLPNTASNIFLATPNANVRNDQATFRVDHNLTSQQQLSLYYYGDDGYEKHPFDTFLASGASLPGFGYRTRDRFQQLNLSHAWTIAAKTINESRFVYYRQGQGQLLAPARTNLVQDSCATVPSTQCFFDPSNPSLGINPGYGARYEGVPLVSLSGGFSFGNNSSGNFSQTGNVYQAADTFSKIIGNHTLKVGGEWRNQRLHQHYFYAVSGQFSFYGEGPNDVGFSSLIPNYLLGLPDSFNQGSANSVDVRSTQFAPFAQDSWRLRPNLVLSSGLRWEWNTPMADASRRVQAFRPGQSTRIYPCVLSPSDPLAAMYGSSDCSPTGPARAVFPLGLVVPGDPGVSDSLTHNYLHSFAPRIGLTWSPDWSTGWLSALSGGPGRTSLRGGWGIFYDSNEELMFGENLAAQPPFGGSTSISNIFFNTPFLSQNGSVTPNPFHGFLDPRPGSPVDFALFRPITFYGMLPPTLRSQYSEHYHLTLQRELPHDTLLQFGYVGSQGHRLTATIDLNYGNAQPCLDLNQIPGMACGPFQEDSDFHVPAGAIPPGVTLHLPYGSVSSVTGPNANPITLVGLRKYSSPFCEPSTGVGCPLDGVPVFASIFSTQPVGNSSYNSLQALLSKRFSHGLQFLTSYTWSKSIDNASTFEESVNPVDPARSRSLSLYDARHRFVFSEYWTIPTPRVANWSRHLITGWNIAGIFTLQSGFPIRLTSTDDEELMGSYNFETVGEPNQIAPFRRLHPQSSGGYFFDPASFAQAPVGQMGNAPRTICCGPGIANLDLGLHKTFRVGEARTLEFRTEFFNVMNHTQFFNPDGNITDGPNFGQISRARDPRLIQLALRLNF
ncbi:MAG TPA: carboxypeptidase regulatory-like domain-containing protein [Candidatus Sulfotelmatobacter sp.]|nr:carboxypeptidase regulatory-like domain-containing protein [Candidatus Sulfotelmatobacter sp.]